MIEDTKKNIALNIIKDILGIIPIEITRFHNGYCHSVYSVNTENEKYVLRLTSNENKDYYFGSIKWLSELIALGIPVPHIIKHGQYSNMYFSLISFINGKDLGEVYHELSDFQKKGIVKELSIIQRKIAVLPNMGLYGYPYSDNGFKTWIEYLKGIIERANQRIISNKIFDAKICDNVTSIMYKFHDYFSKLQPIAFLDDITTKNVLVFEGKLSGIVDIDEMCFGDSLLVIGLTNMALHKMEMDTNYIEYWLDEIDANEIQRKVLIFYTLLFCIDFMGEQGMKFDNDNKVPYDKNVVNKLNSIYKMLLNKLL